MTWVEILGRNLTSTRAMIEVSDCDNEMSVLIYARL